MAKSKVKSAEKSSLKLLAWQKFFIVFLLLAIAANGALGYWAYNRWVVAVEQQQLTELSTQYAQQQAAVVSNYLDSLRKSIRLVASNDALSKALRENNFSLLQRFESEFQNTITAATWVHIYPKGSAQLDPDAAQPIRFAELDMINRAENRAAVFPEASRIDNDWRIAVAEALPIAEAGSSNENGGQDVDGTLFIFLSANDLLAKLGQSNATIGNTQWLQQFSSGRPQPIAQLGEQGVGDGAQVNIPNTHWQILFTPSAALAEQAVANPLLLFLGLAAILLLSLGAAYGLAKIMGEKFGRDDLIIAAAAESTAGGQAAFRDPIFHSKDLLKVEVREEDSSLLGLRESKAADPLDIQDAAKPTAPATDFAPAHIFRSYDIRGDAETEINSQLVVAIGRAVGSLALEAGDSSMYVARDGRNTSPEFQELLIEGIVSTGCNVLNLGMVPTPLLNFAIYEQKKTRSGVMVTASHNPANFNGFKIVINNKPLFDDSIQALRARIAQGDFLNKGAGREENAQIVDEYIERIFSDVALAGALTVVVDAGNGVTGMIAPRMLEELGCNVVPLFCNVDGDFPNHEPDPSVDSNLNALIAKVKSEGADIGIALDGDGDRLGLVTASGAIVRADRILMLLAKDIVSRNPGADVVFDVKSSRELNTVITTYGGRPIMWKSGHSPMRSKMVETKALVGGELSGHIFIGERWYGFDDGLYAAIRILEIMSLRDQDLDSMLASLPNPPATGEIRIPIDENKKFNFIRDLIEQADFVDGRVTTIDGLRVDFEKGWGLVRASNTSAALTLRFEAETPEILHDIQQQFKYQMLKVDHDLIVAF